jgi:hypothetical protein
MASRPVGIGGGGRCPLTQLFDENVRLNLLVIYVHVRTYLLVILYLLHTRKNQRTNTKAKEQACNMMSKSTPHNTRSLHLHQ